MSTLSVQDRNGVLVADSRLIALELGIQHKNFLATIEKYNPVMASNPEMQPVAFEARVVKRPQGGTYEERMAWLNEAQATFIMTLSRNTEQVVKCKLALSIAFDKAKKVIQETIPAPLVTS
jgi:phage regulator Rha-like protein